MVVTPSLIDLFLDYLGGIQDYPTVHIPCTFKLFQIRKSFSNNLFLF